MSMASRNSPLGFAARTLKNLEYVEGVRTAGVDVHVVTQRVVSLLGLVVLPYANGLDAAIENLSLDELAARGWPTWDITHDTKGTTTLGVLLKRVRNAVAHGHIVYGPPGKSDSRDPKGVTIEVDDRESKTATPHWRATISADDLLVFCRKLAARLEQLEESA